MLHEGVDHPSAPEYGCLSAARIGRPAQNEYDLGAAVVSVHFISQTPGRGPW